MKNGNPSDLTLTTSAFYFCLFLDYYHSENEDSEEITKRLHDKIIYYEILIIMICLIILVGIG